MCDCFHLAFPNWHAASSGTGAGRRLRGPEPGTEDDSVCDEPSQFTEEERPRPQGSSPVEEFPVNEKYTDSDKECEHDPRHKGGGKKTKKSGLGSMFEKRSTPKMSKLKEVPSPESGVIVKTAKDGDAEGLVYGGGGKEGLFIKEVVPESPASKNLQLKEGDQILSATVYFDNVPYEDAIQILEHAQAYNVKLCLKRKPEIMETETAMESDVIPEDEFGTPAMREKGKTKRRGDARISWPKFPSLGRGRKSRFTRSHSSSEADEQRKLELSPTTSDTESPIKSQDALKGKKRQKMKLSVLTKRGRMSSSEEPDTDAPTTGQTSSDIHQTVADMLSPECLESLTGEVPEVYVTEEHKAVEDLNLVEQQTVQHKVELISIDSTLKTEDLTVALGDHHSPSVVKSPKEKKNKKERSQLKMKILGKEKSRKKDAKPKGSPKRLKTLGASIEMPDAPVIESTQGGESHAEQGDTLPLNTQITSSGSPMEKSMSTQMDISIPAVELDFSDVPFMRKSPQKEHAKKEDIKQKQDTKTRPTFKIPKLGFSDIETEKVVQQVKVETDQLRHEGTAVKEDPYDRLLKSSQLPKREDIVIPGMEDRSPRAKAKGIKEPWVDLYDENHSEPLQLSIDVNSVKEAVSKLPGYKLPKVDTSGMPIPEEITVIDANAQRISVKTPTKVADTKSKHEGYHTKVDMTTSSVISKTIKLPRTTPADLISEEPLIETKAHYKKTEKVHKTMLQSEKDRQGVFYKRDDIIIPGKESEQGSGKDTESQSAAMSSPKKSADKASKSKMTMASFGITTPVIKLPETGIEFPKQNICQESVNIFGERTIVLQDQSLKADTSRDKGQIGAAVSDVKVQEIDSIEYIDSVGDSPAKTRVGRNVPADVDKKMTDGVEKDGVHTYEIPNLDISFPNFKESVAGLGLSKKDKDATLPATKTDDKLDPIGHVQVCIPGKKAEVEASERDRKTLQTEKGPSGKGSMFKLPKLSFEMPKLKGPEFSKSKSGIDVTLPAANAEIEFPEAPQVDVARGKVDVTTLEKNSELEMEIKPLEAEVKLDGQGNKFKTTTFGIKVPKIQAPSLDLSLSKKDVDLTQQDSKAEVKLPGAPDVEVTLGSVDVSIPEAKVEVEKPKLEIKPLDAELHVQESKIKISTFEIKMPKFKGPEVDLSLSKKDIDITLPEAKDEIKLPDAPDVEVTLGSVDVTIPEPKVEVEKPELEIETKGIDVELDRQGSKFKMPKLGIKKPKIKGPELDLSLSKKDTDITLPEAKAEVKLPDAPDVEVSLARVDVSIPKPVEKSEVEIKPLLAQVEVDGQASKFKIPKFGIKIPTLKGPEMDLSLSKKDVDITLPEATAELQLPDAPSVEVTPASVDFSISEPKVEFDKPEVELKPLDVDIELDGQGSKFKMPKFGFKMPKMKGPDIDLSLSKKDVNITLPGAEAEVKLPDAPDVECTLGSVDVSKPKAEFEKPEVEIKPLDVHVDLEGQGSKFKMPKFGFKMPKMKGPEIDLSLSKKDVDMTLPGAEVKLPDAPDVEVTLGSVDVSIPEQKLEVEKPEVEIKPLDVDIELDGQGSKFKMPKFGIKMPKFKGPEIDMSLSKKDIDITLPGAEAEVKLPDAPNVEVTLGSVDVSIPESKLEVEKPEVEIKPLDYDIELDGQGSKFKMPKFGFKMPKMKGPDIDLSLSKKDVDITLPGAEAEVKLPDAPDVEVTLGSVGVSIPEQKLEVEKPEVEIKPLDVDIELDGQGTKFKMPKFGIKMPKFKGPEIDMSLSKKDIDIKLPGAEAEVKLPDAPDVEVTLGSVDVSIPETKLEVEKPEVGIKPLDYDIELDGQGSKFKMPKFGFKMPKMKGPDIDLSLSKKDVEVTLPEAKGHIKLPDAPDVEVTLGSVDVSIPEQKLEVEKPEVEIKPLDVDIELDGQGSKFKMPKFGFKMPKMKGPDIDLSLSKKDVDITLPEAEVKLPDAPDVEVTLGSVDVSIPEQKLEVEKPEVEIKPLDYDIELDGQGSRFKMPKFGFKMPKMKGPDIDLSLSKKDVDVTRPEAKGDIKLPDAPDFEVTLGSADVSIPEPKLEVVDIKPPEIDVQVDRQGSKFKMPKFGVKKPKIKGPDVDLSLSKKDIDIKLPEANAEVKLPHVPDVEVTLESVDVSIPEPKVDFEQPEVDIKPIFAEVEFDGQGSKFKMPQFGFKMPKIKGPDIDLSLSKKDVDITLPGAEAEVKLPDAPDVEVTLGSVDVSIPEQKLEVEKPEVEIKPLDVDIELDGQGSRFKMPKFGFKMPKIKGPELDLSLSRKDKDVTLPEAKAEIKLPEAPDVEVTLGSVDVSIPDPKVEFKKPDVEIKPLDVDIELDGQGSKFKMPKFGIKMPKIQGPDIDLSLPKKDVDITLPEAKAEVKLPDAPDVEVTLGSVDVSKPKAEFEKPEVEIKPLDVHVDLDGQGTKFKMPKFGIKMPKFKGPEIDMSLSKKDIDMTLPGAEAEVKLPDAPDVEVTLGSVDVSIPEQKLEVEKPEVEIKPLDVDIELDGQGSKFKMPRFGIKMPKFKGPEIDMGLSKKDIDIKLPGAEAEVKLPDAPDVEVTLGSVDVSIPESKLEVEKPEVEIKPLDYDIELDGQGSKFKMPKFGFKMPKMKGPDIDLSLSKKDVDITLPGAEAEVKLPDAPDVEVTLGSVDVSIPESKLEVEKPEVEIKPLDYDIELDGQGSRFKMPKFGFKMPKMKGPDIDLSLSKKDVDVTRPEAKGDIKLPDAPDFEVTLGSADVSIPEPKLEVVDIKPPEIDVQVDRQGSKFKMPKFGVKKPKIKGPDVDLSLSKKDIAIKLPEANAEVKLPHVPDVEVTLESVDVSIPEPKVDFEQPEVDIKPIFAEVEFDGQGSKFKMPQFGFKMPKIKGPDIDLSLSKKDVDITLPGAEAEVKLPDAPDVEVTLGSVDVSIPEQKLEVEKPEVEIKPLDVDIELDGQGSRFKMPKFGFKMPKIKGPELDLSLSRKDKDVTLPEAKADIKLPEAPDVEVTLGSVDVSIPEPKVEFEKPDVEIKPLDVDIELDGQGSKFKMPKFGIKMPKIQGPDIDLSLPKKDVDITLPEAKAEVKLPDAPDVEVTLGSVDVSKPKAEFEKPEVEIKPLDVHVDLDGQGTKFKMPKFGIKMPKFKGPEIDMSLSKKDVDIKLPGAEAEVKLPDAPDVEVTLGSVDVSIPESKLEVEKPEVEIKPLDYDIELDGQGSKFKMPKFGFKMPKMKGPDIDLSLSKKDVDITLPGAEAEVKLPDAPDVEVTLGSVDVSIPDPKVEVEKPKVEIKPLDVDVELDGQGSKFKMPKFGIKMPKMKGPEIDLSLPKKEVNVTLPEAKVDIKAPDAHPGEEEVKAPEIDIQSGRVKGSPSKFKLPSFKLPKFGVSIPDVKAEVPDRDIEVEVPELDVNLGKAEVSIPEAKIEVKKPEVEIKPLELKGELDGKGSKLKMPMIGMSMPEVKGPEIDLSLSKKDVDVKLPEAEAEVNLPDVELKGPSAKVEVKVPEIEVKSGSVKGSPSKFKLPTFKFPKFGVATPNVRAEVPDTEKEIKVDVEIPEVPDIDVHLEKAEVSIPEATIEVQKPEVEVPTLEFEGDLKGQGSTLKMPKIGMSMPKVKGPEIDLSLSKKDVDIKVPEAEVHLPDIKLKEPSAKVEVKVPEIEVQSGSVKASPSKFKMPSFKFPKFGIATPNIRADMPDTEEEIKVEVEIPAVPDIDVSIGKAEVSIPEAKIEVQKPEVEVQSLELDGDHKGQGRKLKMPKIGMSMPEVKGPEIDLSLLKKDVNVQLPEAETEVHLPDVELKGASAKVEVKVPEIEVQSGSSKGSPSKFKMPTFKFPKFGIATPIVRAEVPDTEQEIKVEVEIPEVPDIDVNLGKAEVSIPEAKIEVKKPEVEIKPLELKGELDGKGSKLKMPMIGMSMPEVKGPAIDLSLTKKDVDVKLSQAEAEVNLSEAEVDIKVPDIEVQPGSVKASPSKFKMPTFKFPKFGVSTPNVKAEVPDTVDDIKVEVEIPDVPDIDVNLGKAEVSISEAKIEVQKPELEVQHLEGELDGRGSKLKMPKIGMSMPKVGGLESDLSLSTTDVDIKLPEAEAEVNLPDVELQGPSAKVEVKVPEAEVQLGSVRESPSRFKLPTFKFPKFGIATPHVSAEVPETDIKTDGADLDIAINDTSLDIAAENIDVEVPSLDVKTTIEGEEKESKFKMPKFGFSMPKVQGPKIDLTVSKKNVDIHLPESEAEVKLQGVPETDVNIGKAEVSIPGATIEVQKPEIKMKSLPSEREAEGQKSKFKMPKFGMSIPKVQGPEIDFSVSKKDANINSPEAEEEVNLPDVELKGPSAKVEVKAPEIEVQSGNVKGSPSKYKLPSFKFPKMGVGTSSISAEGPITDENIKIDVKIPEIPETDVSLGKAEVSIPEAKVEIQKPEVEIKGELDGQDFKVKKPRFSMPKISLSKSSVKAPGADVSGPEGKVEVMGDVDVKLPEHDTESDSQGSKFKMPKLGITMSTVTGPEIDLSLPKKEGDVTIPEVKGEVQLPDVEMKEPSAEVDIKPTKIKVGTKDKEGSPSKFKMPSFKFPKFGDGSPKSKIDKDVKLNEADIKFPEEVLTVDIAAPSISKADVRVALPEAKVDVTLPETKTDVHLPDEDKESTSISAAVDHDAKSKKSRFSLPKFTFPRQSSKEMEVDVSLPDVDVSLPEGSVEGAPPQVELKSTEGGVKVDGQSKFKVPKFGISVPKVKGPDTDLSLSKKEIDVALPKAEVEAEIPEGPKIDVEVTSRAGDSPSKLKISTVTLPKLATAALPEGKAEVTLPSVEIKDSLDQDAPTAEVEGKLKRSTWSFPKFSFSKTSGKGSDVDVKTETPKVDVDVTSPEVEVDISLPDVEAKGPTGTISMQDPPTAEPEANLRRSKFSLPKISFSKSSDAAPQVSSEPLRVEVSLPEGEVRVKLAEPEIKTQDLETKHDVAESKFKLPKFGVALPKAKGPEADLTQTDVDITLPGVKTEVKLPEVEVKESSAGAETDAKSKDVGGSPLKFKMPSLKMPKFGGASYEVSVEVPETDKAETYTVKPEEAVTFQSPSVEVKSDMAKAVTMESDAPTTDTDRVGHGSPSRFKLPSFKMPKLSFSRSKPEEESATEEHEIIKDQPATEEETKSPVPSLTSFSDILQNFDVEFDVSIPEKEEGDVETSKLSKQQTEAKEEDASAKQDVTKSPEKTGWFKFPRFGLSSPSEPAKVTEKDDKKSPVAETRGEEMSPTSSIQSSDAFADVSSTMTSEPVGLSLSSPTKVTVKYSDPNGAPELEETHSKVITSTTKTQVISVEPNRPEKITILSSGTSSLSEDTLKLKSEKIHVITSNIQATPEAHHAKILTAIQVQPVAGPTLKSLAGEGASWTVEESHGGKKTVFERRVISETSSQRSESKETVVITKQVTHISGETATSIQRLRDSVHTEKMRFFDGAKK